MSDKRAALEAMLKGQVTQESLAFAQNVTQINRVANTKDTSEPRTYSGGDPIGDFKGGFGDLGQAIGVASAPVQKTNPMGPSNVGIEDINALMSGNLRKRMVETPDLGRTPLPQNQPTQSPLLKEEILKEVMGSIKSEIKGIVESVVKDEILNIVLNEAFSEARLKTIMEGKMDKAIENKVYAAMRKVLSKKSQ
jgi:hypothetical protein